MAMYEYRCQDCEKLFTVQERISEHEEKGSKRKCPHCGGKKSERMYSGFFAKTARKS